MLVVDFETYLIRPGLLAPPPVVASFIRPEDAAPYLLPPDEACDLIELAIRHEEILVGQNVAFDFAVCVAHRPSLLKPVFDHYKKGLVRDTKIRQQLLDIASGELKLHENEDGKMVKTSYSLAALAKRHLDLYVEKGESTWRLRYSELAHTPIADWPEEAREYALNDALVTRDVYLAQGGDIVNEVEQTQAAFALHLASVWGVRTDPVAVSALKTKLETEQAAARRDLIAAGFYKGVPFTTEDRKSGRVPDFYGKFAAKSRQGEPRPMKYGKDMAVIRARVEATFVGRVVPRTESGEVSTDKDALEMSGDPLLQMLADIGGVDKVLQTYIPVLEQGTDVPINASFNVLVATGRTSSYRPNLQNLPGGRRVQGVRECFVARSSL